MAETNTNRLTDGESAVLTALRRWFNYRTSKNTRLLVFAARDWLREQHTLEDGRKAT